uniref:Uncharacterized protein n=1 Tax=Parascaris equorum TaxID=6256 RepID=A0A914RLK8_PAREQ
MQDENGLSCFECYRSARFTVVVVFSDFLKRSAVLIEVSIKCATVSHFLRPISERF